MDTKCPGLHCALVDIVRRKDLVFKRAVERSLAFAGRYWKCCYFPMQKRANAMEALILLGSAVCVLSGGHSGGHGIFTGTR